MKKYENENKKHSTRLSTIKWLKRIRWITMLSVAISILLILVCQAPQKQAERTEYSNTPVSLSFVISDCMLK